MTARRAARYTVRAAAGVLVALALARTLWHGVMDPRDALALGLFIAVGEAARWGTGPGEREPAPLGAAGVLAYALLGESAGRIAGHGVLQTVAVTFAATLAGGALHGPSFDHLARRALTAAFAAACFQPWYVLGGSSYMALLLLLLVLTALCDALLSAVLRETGSGTAGSGATGWGAVGSGATGWGAAGWGAAGSGAPGSGGTASGAAGSGTPFGPLLREELRSLGGIASAVCATGAVTALGVAVAGLWALPVFCVPLLLTQLSFRRYAAVRTTYRQTIASLARATEIAGYTRQGHARRVAELSCAVGRDLGLTGRELTVLEYAALMHDIGQLSLVDPVPEGATEPLPEAEQRRIALLGGAVVRQTGVPSAVAVVVERQADPYREQPLPARIVRTVNAYDDLAGDNGTPGGTLGALERLRLGTARDYHPDVVESLARVLARGGLAPALVG